MSPQPAPTLTGYTPMPTASEVAQTITLTGQRLKSVDSVVLNSKLAGTVEHVSATAITWRVVLATAGQCTISVRDTDGQVSNAIPLTVGPAVTEPPIEPPIEPPDPIYGPRVIGKPDGAIDVPIGADLQQLTNQHPAGSTFWILAGVRAVTSSIIPKSGNRYVGEYGAIFDGTGWTTSNHEDGAFRAHNEPLVVEHVTIENLVLRNMPQRGVHAYWTSANAWTVAYCEIFGCKEATALPSRSLVSHNYLHDNRRPEGPIAGGAYGMGGDYPNTVADTVSEYNHIARNGYEQKYLDATGMIWRHNWCHDNDGPAIWNDGVGEGFIAEDNLLENNAIGIFFEISIGAVIRRNTFRRNHEHGVFLSTSRDCDVYENTFEMNQNAVTLFVDTGSVTQGWGWQPDLRNNYTHHNLVIVSNVGSGGTFSHSSAGTDADRAPYIDNTKNNRWDFNEYRTPAGAWAWYWLGTQSWDQWRGRGFDVNGTLIQERECTRSGWPRPDVTAVAPPGARGATR